MSLDLMIAANVLADAALIGGLSWAMSRASRLTPHGLVRQTALSVPTTIAAPRRHDRLSQQQLLPASPR